MPLNRSQRHYRLWLAAGTAVMAVAMAVLLSLQLTQKQAIADSSKLRIDSVIVLAFQMERELLRLQNTMERMVQSPSAADIDALLMRQDIFASRYQLMTDNPTVVVLLERAEYLQAMSKLKALIERTDAVLATAPRLEPAALKALLQEIDQLAPDMQALTMVANTHIARQLEDQESALLKQADKILWLIWVQMVLLFLASATLTVQHRRQDKERRALQQLTRDLQYATAAAETANRGKSQFLATMSHELRTPFNGMLGMLTLLETTPLDVQQRDYLVTARGSAGHLLTLLNDILDVSALEAGRMDIHPTPVCVPDLFGDVQHLMQPLAAQKQLGFSMVIAAEVPAWLETDGTRLKQIVLNLVSNAIKFSEHGNVSVTVDCTLEPPADCTHTQQPSTQKTASVALRIRVQDSGIGMDAATMDRLFQRFSQGDASTSRRFGGTGLGLEISRSLARLMGGDIQVTSQVGEGSLFTVALHLPLAAAPPNHAVGVHDLSYRPEGMAGLDIVVAEDQAINRKYMAGLLERMGHQVRFAEDGVQAVAEVQRCTPDLVLMDLHMPLMDGLEATRRLRALIGTAAASVPVVALTADAFEETREQARAAGMTAFLSKPASADAIQTVLSDLFGTRGSPSAPSSVPPAPPPASAAGNPTAKAPLAAARKGPRRRFKPGDVARHLDMAMVGDVCIAISFNSYRSLADEFFQDKSASLTALMQALRDRNSKEIHAAAHAFKGSSAMLGFHALAACALRIEQQGAAGELDALNEASTALGNAWTTVHAIAHRMAITSVDEPTPVTELLAEASASASADTVPP